MRYVSLFSGIEAASVAWRDLGWQAVAFSEIDKFACDVLDARFPDAPNLGDITLIDWSDFIERSGTPDVMVGGSPCQSFSVAGGRESLSGESRLCFEYVRAARDIKPRWLVWENVPGVLSTKDNAFGQFVMHLWDCGFHDIAWRILDSQFFGVAQRRRRVFVVGYLGAGFKSAAVLFEPDIVRRYHPSSREKRQELTNEAFASSENCCGFSAAVSATAGNIGYESEISPTLLASRNDASVIYDTTQITSQQNHANPQPGDPCHTLSAHGHAPLLCVGDCNANAAVNDNLAPTLKCGGDPSYIASEHIVRRLSPLECERLQGFPDGWTDIYDTTPDTPRYRALGNSMAVPVMRWIGERIAQVDALVKG